VKSEPLGALAGENRGRRAHEGLPDDDGRRVAKAQARVEGGGSTATLHGCTAALDGRPDEVLEALQAVVAGLMENAARIDVALERAAQIRKQRLEGRTYTEIVEGCQGPLIVEIMTANLFALSRLGHRLRSVEARALHEEGLSSVNIARLFGVSRQRIVALLQSPLGNHPHEESC
jgi:hypothetical protein